MGKTKYKTCLVPMCINSAIKMPSKIFIRLPNSANQTRREKWSTACRRNTEDISEKSGGVYVCEDHFNLKEDMENYIQFKLMGGNTKIKMKPGVVPHIFNSKPDRKRACVQPSRPTSVNRAKPMTSKHRCHCAKRRIVDEALASIASTTTSSSVENLENIKPVQVFNEKENQELEKKKQNRSNQANKKQVDVTFLKK
ncbi:unnamed protein product [Ceutorhynchus assimilis]|uniref:THAP-type domain-containing protein n=1 Tax=Ceutorhynchus assimilis TaxID=467358 RepID=A0A9N9MTP1_9CUCU|nr:unnamed protein product [Ceutorhynchus assimilis]